VDRENSFLVLAYAIGLGTPRVFRLLCQQVYIALKRYLERRIQKR